MAIVGIVRAYACVASLVLCATLVACSGVETPQGGSAPSPSSTTSSASPEDTPESSPAPSATSGASAPDQPIDKVSRDGKAPKPTLSAEPASTSGAVSYTDSVKVEITSVSFDEETSEGPGSFTGREYARLTITIANGSDDPIDLGTAVLTLLDSDGTPLTKVYAPDAEAVDFSGTLKPGKKAKASYAFAVPADARSEITLVVDFDAIHTSAIFRGGLS